MAAKVDHFAFRVSDLDTALGFYCNALGLKQLSRTVDPEHGEAFAYIELQGGNLELLQCLHESPKPLPDSRPSMQEPFCPHLAIATEDLEEQLRTLIDNGVTIIKGPLEIAGLVKWLYIADPDGNVIEYVQWLHE